MCDKQYLLNSIKKESFSEHAVTGCFHRGTKEQQPHRDKRKHKCSVTLREPKGPETHSQVPQRMKEHRIPPSCPDPQGSRESHRGGSRPPGKAWDCSCAQDWTQATGPWRSARLSRGEHGTRSKAASCQVSLLLFAGGLGQGTALSHVCDEQIQVPAAWGETYHFSCHFKNLRCTLRHGHQGGCHGGRWPLVTLHTEENEDTCHHLSR